MKRHRLLWRKLSSCAAADAIRLVLRANLKNSETLPIERDFNGLSVAKFMLKICQPGFAPHALVC